MPLPLTAFIESYPANLATGSVFRLRNEWGLLVGHEDPAQRELLMLTGDRAGTLHRLIQGMPKCVALAPEFSWFAASAAVEAIAASERQTAAITLTPRGPVVIGAIHDRFEDNYAAFALNGVVDRDYEPYGAGQRLLTWTAELAHPSRPFESLGTLFTVQVEAPQR